MSTTVLIITSVTLFVILGSIYLEIRRQIKPRIKVYFPDGSTQASYKPKEEVSIALHITNIGRFGFPKPAATEVGMSVYTPITFLLKRLEYGDEYVDEVTRASSGGIFGGMHYIGAKLGLYLSHKEEEVVKLLAEMPEDTGRYPIKVSILSDQGDLGIHELEIIVS